MTVNAFWMGVLLTIVCEIVAAIILALIASRRAGDEDGGMAMDEEEFRAMIYNAVLESIDQAMEQRKDLDDGEKE